MTVRELRFSDLPMQLLPGRLQGSDLARTHASLCRPEHRLSPLDLALWTVAPQPAERAFAVAAGARLGAIAVVRQRQGPRAWEIAHLFAGAEAMPDGLALFERCAGWVASRGGERLFLRTPFGGPVEDIARRSGFMPALQEEVYLQPRDRGRRQHDASATLRPVMTTDTHGLFRLYNTVVPASIRPLTGLTLEQWLDALERPAGVARELVREEQGRLRAWVRIARAGAVVSVDSILQPESPEDVLAVAAEVARVPSGAGTAVYWVVPGHQPGTARALRSLGWALQQTNAVLVRPVAKPVEERAWLPAQA